MMYYKTMLVGPQGGGKTYSFRNLDKVKTIFINGENKPLPFSPTFEKMSTPRTVSEAFALLDKAANSTTSDLVIYDSFSSFLDMNMKESRASFKGYDIFNNYNSNISKFNERIKDMQKDVIITAHYEYVGDELTGMREKRVKTKGKEWEGMIEKDYTIVIYSQARPNTDPSKRPEFYFRLVTDGMNSAKTPPDIFGIDVLEIGNDSKILFDKIQEFKAKK